MNTPDSHLPLETSFRLILVNVITASRVRNGWRVGRNVMNRSMAFCVRSAALMALCVATPFLAAASSWQWLSPSPTGNHLSSFAFGNGQFVGAGNHGEILTSPDGVTWTPRESGTLDLISRVIYDGTRFRAISGTSLLSSSDGIVWTKQSAPASLYDIAAGNNLLVAIAAPAGAGLPYRLLTSTDGIAWTANDSPAQPMRILFANGVFVAVDTSGHALSSSDGLTWTTTQIPGITNTPFAAAGNGRFLVSYGVKTCVSTDGITWRDVTSHPVGSGQQPLTVPFLEGSVAGSTMGFAGGYFYIQQSRYANDAYRFYRSSDGETWESVPVFWSADLTTLASGGGAMVATEQTVIYAGPNPGSYAIHSSTDGVAWTARTNVRVNSVSSLVYGLGRFFAGGKVSNDSLSWVDSPFEPTHSAGDLVFRISSKYPFNTHDTTIIDPRAVTSVVVSADGLTGLTVDVKMATPRSVAFGAVRYVAVGDSGNVSCSPDGLTWTAGSSGTNNDLLSVIFAFNRFIAIGASGTLITSPDGLTWTVQNTSTTANFLSVAAGIDRVVVGTAGSPTPVSPLTLSGNLTIQIATTRRSDALLWFDGEFTSVEFLANNNLNAITSVARSTDGSTWTEVILRFSPGYSGRALVATGNGTALMLLPGGIGWISQLNFPALFQKHISTSAVPTITHSPAATTVHQGETAIFSVGVTGNGPFTYQWNRNGIPVPGATSQIFSLPLAKDSDAGDFTVTVTNSSGSATSAPAKLTVQSAIPLTITKQPVGGTLYEFQSFFLIVEVTGSGPVTYQWRRNGSPIGSATSATLEIYTASYSMDNYTGNYDVVVTAPSSTVTSQTVTVSRSGPSATVSKSDAANPDRTMIVTAAATGKSPFTYTWRRTGGLRLVGADNSTLILPNLTSADNSSYSVTVTDADGISTQAFFTVTSPGPDSGSTTNQASATAGQQLTLRVPIGISDLTGLSFQWRFKNAPIAGATDWSYTTPAITDATTGDYAVVVTSTANSSTTTYMTTVVLGDATPVVPSILAQTTSRTISAGSATTFSVSAGDATVSSYQWQVSTNGGGTWTNLTNGAPYSGATTNTLTITGATAAMSGYQYRCVATNAAGNTTSIAASLSISNDPVLVHPIAIARDSSGNLFVSDASANVIRKVTPAGVTSIFAGAAGNAGSGDGTGSAVRFNQPGGLAFDSTGNLYVADTGNATIRKITTTGVVTTLAGDPAVRGNVDALGVAARFNHPTGLAADSNGGIYVTDTFSHTVRKITSGGSVTTLAGTNGISGSTDGSGPAARFSGPAGVAVDAGGTVYVADTGNSTLRKITASGAVTTLAGLPGVGGSNDGTGRSALFSQPTSVAIDANGTVYVADTGNALIRRVTSAGAVTLLAGVPGIAGLSDGVGLDALLDQPHGLALDGNGNLFVVDTGNAALRKITSNGTVTTLALVAATPAPVTDTPTSPSGGGGTSSPATNSGGRGGGSMEAWFGLLLLGLGITRLRLVWNERF